MVSGEVICEKLEYFIRTSHDIKGNNYDHLKIRSYTKLTMKAELLRNQISASLSICKRFILVNRKVHLTFDYQHILVALNGSS